MRKRILSMILTLVMILTMVPISAFAVTGEEGEQSELTVGAAAAEVPVITWTQSEVRADGGEGTPAIYKLVGHVKSAHGVKTLLTALNFDNTVIQPVIKQKYTDFTYVDSNKPETTVFPLLTTVGGYGPVPYQLEGITYVKDGRSTAEVTLLNNGAQDIPIDADYLEFYFRLADGKTWDDVNKSTFKFESLASSEPVHFNIMDAANHGWTLRPEGAVLPEGIIKFPEGQLPTLTYTNSTVEPPKPVVNVASVNGVGYQTLQAAFDGLAGQPGTVKLLMDVTESVTIPQNASTPVLELGEFTLTGDGSTPAILMDKADSSLKVTATTGGINGTSAQSAIKMDYKLNADALVIEGGTYTGKYAVETTDKVTKSATIKLSNASLDGVTHSVGIGDPSGWTSSATVVINNCEFVKPLAGLHIHEGQMPKVYINGGTFDKPILSKDNPKHYTLYINGGTFNASPWEVGTKINATGTYEPTITSGTFNTDITFYDAGGKQYAITGGTFNGHVKAEPGSENNTNKLEIPADSKAKFKFDPTKEENAATITMDSGYLFAKGEDEYFVPVKAAVSLFIKGAEQFFMTVQDAIDAAQQNAAEVVLHAPAHENLTIAKGQDITFKITPYNYGIFEGADPSKPAITNHGKLLVRTAPIKGGNDISVKIGTTATGTAIINDGTLRLAANEISSFIENQGHSTITVGGDQTKVGIENSGVLTLKPEEFHTKGYNGLTIKGTETALKVNGAEASVEVEPATLTGGVGMLVSNAANVAVNSGNFVGTTGAAIKVDAGNVTINGGRFKGVSDVITGSVKFAEDTILSEGPDSEGYYTLVKLVKHNVTWQNGDGSAMKTDGVIENTATSSLVAPEEKPTKAALGDGTTFEFVKWNIPEGTVTGDITIKPAFKTIPPVPQKPEPNAPAPEKADTTVNNEILKDETVTELNISSVINHKGEVGGKVVSVGFDAAATEAIKAAVSTGSEVVKLTTQALDKTSVSLTEAQKKVIGEKDKIFDLTLTVDNKKLEFGGGKASVKLPFDLGGRAPEAFTVFYIDEQGEKTKMSADYREGGFVFDTGHFSTYTVANTSGTASDYNIAIKNVPESLDVNDTFTANIVASRSQATKADMGAFQFELKYDDKQLQLVALTGAGACANAKNNGNKLSFGVDSETGVTLNTTDTVIATAEFKVLSGAVDLAENEIGFAGVPEIGAINDYVSSVRNVSSAKTTLHNVVITLNAENATIDSGATKTLYAKYNAMGLYSDTNRSVAVEDVTLQADPGWVIEENQWKLSGTEETVADYAAIKAKTYQASATYDLQVKHGTYNVTWPEGVTGDASASHSTDFSFIPSKSGEIVTDVTYTVVGGADNKAAVKNDDGSYTIPKADIIGDITISMNTVQGSWEFISDRVYRGIESGHKVAKLVTAKAGNGYALTDHNSMFWSSAYNAYVCIVGASETADMLSSKLTTAKTPCVEIEYKGDLNKNGSTTAIDSLPINAALHQLTDLQYTIDDRMRFEMDVTKDGKVTTADIIWILEDAIGLPHANA